MRKVNDGEEEHYIEVVEITVERPPEIHLEETELEVTGKFVGLRDGV